MTTYFDCLCREGRAGEGAEKEEEEGGKEKEEKKENNKRL